MHNLYTIAGQVGQIMTFPFGTRFRLDMFSLHGPEDDGWMALRYRLVDTSGASVAWWNENVQIHKKFSSYHGYSRTHRMKPISRSYRQVCHPTGSCFHSAKWFRFELRFVIFYNARLWQFTTLTGVCME